MSTATSPAPGGRAASEEARAKANVDAAIARRSNFIFTASAVDVPHERRARNDRDYLHVFPTASAETQRGRALAEPAPSQPHIVKFLFVAVFYVALELNLR